MMMGVAAYIALFGGMFALVLAGGQAFVRKPDWKNLVLALFWLSAAGWQIAAGWGGLVQPGGFAANITSIAGNATSAFTGPLFYLFFYRSIVASESLRRRDVFHFLPALAASLLFLPVLFEPARLQDPAFEDAPTTRLAAIFCAGVLVLYLAATYFRLRRLAETSRFLLKPMINMIRFTTIAAFVMSLGVLFLYSLWLNAAATVLILLSFWFSIRYPRLFHLLREEVGKARYTNSRLGTLNMNEFLPRLRALMEAEELYAREDIRLKDIAAKMEVSEYQLSEILNSRLSLNFHGFLNSYRIAAAKRILEQEPDVSVLAAGLRAGFNSNSSFYTAFRAETGMSPGRYRKSREL